jgi:ATP-dependent DNA helicase
MSDLSEMRGDVLCFSDASSCSDEERDADAASSSSVASALFSDDDDDGCDEAGRRKAAERQQLLEASQKQLKALLQKASAVTEHLLLNPAPATTTTRDKATQHSTKDRSKLSGTDEYGFFLRPAAGGDYKLLQHQVYGVQWLLSLFRNGQNGILADEMGLGKTVQVVAFLSALFGYRVFGTHLIVAPLSTLDNWRSEISKWMPWCPLIVYHGNKDERASMRTWLKQRRLKCLKGAAALLERNARKEPIESLVKDIGGIVLTSFEMTMMDSASLGQGLPWDVLVVDEAHRLKNFDCKLIRTLRNFQTEARLLLSGTPLQNNVSELWSMLNFIVPWMFSDLKSFKTWFSEVAQQQQQQQKDDDECEEGDAERGNGGKLKRRRLEGGPPTVVTPDAIAGIVKDCHAVLRPFLLRRTKQQIPQLSIPPKYEVVLYCPLFPEQEKQYEAVRSGSKYQLGRMMQLRKVCGHPFLFREFDSLNDAVRKNGGSTTWATVADGGLCATAAIAAKQNEEYLQKLLAAGSKLNMLHRMLPHLRRSGHRVLLFSQMTKVLDVVEDYLEKMAACRSVKYTYVRLDGSCSLLERKDSIDRFAGKKQQHPNQPRSSFSASPSHQPDSKGQALADEKAEDIFLFLISTRSGGIGLNLVAADTVILYDCDFNPQNDLQATDRCHRIGQTKPVVVYRLISPRTVEEAMMKISLQKIRLERIVIGCGEFSGLNMTSSSGGPSSLRQLLDEVPQEEGAKSADETLLQAMTLSMAFGDTSRYAVTDEELAKLMDRRAVAAECEAAKKKD